MPPGLTDTVCSAQSTQFAQFITMHPLYQDTCMMSSVQWSNVALNSRKKLHDCVVCTAIPVALKCLSTLGTSSTNRHKRSHLGPWCCLTDVAVSFPIYCILYDMQFFTKSYSSVCLCLSVCTFCVFVCAEAYVGVSAC